MKHGEFRRRTIVQGIVALAALLIAHGMAMAAISQAVITSPANNAIVSGTVAIDCKVGSYVSWINVYIDGNYWNSSPPYVFSWDSTSVGNGSHTISISAYSSKKRLVGSSSVTINVENGATPTPTPVSAVSITAPTNNQTVSGTVSVSTAVSSSVAWINVYIDGNYFASSPPYTFSWDSTSVSNGSHTISAKAFASNDTLLGTASAAVNVQNAATASPTPSASPSPTATPTPDPVSAASPSATPSPTPTPSPSPAVSGTAYYIDSVAGSDSNSGTSSGAAWQTLSKAQSFISGGGLTPGDAMLFARGGAWIGGLTLTGINGSASARIIIGNYGSGAPPIIDGGSSAKYGFYASSGSWFTIDGFEVRNTTYNGVSLHSSGGAMPGIIVQNMNIHNTGPGAYAGGGGAYDDGGYRNQLELLDFGYHADGTQFLNNTVDNCGGHNCIQIHGDVGNPVIAGNNCYGWDHNCIDVKAVVGAIVKDNVVHDGQAGSAYYIENTAIPNADVTWEGDVAYNVGNGLECEGGGGSSNQAVTCRAYNNTLYLGGQSAIVTGSDCTQPIAWDVRNNILDTTDTLYMPSNCGNRSMTWDYNDDGASQGTVGGPSGPHDMNGVNPDYVNASGYNFHLDSISPLLNAGEPGLTSGNNDIGAY